MSFKKCALASLALSLAICTGPATAHAADDGVITKPSKYSVKESVTRFEAAVKQKEVAGLIVFTEIDHAAAAKKFGLDLRPRSVIVFGNPKLGTPAMVKSPLLAIDGPPKALVWLDGRRRRDRHLLEACGFQQFVCRVKNSLRDTSLRLRPCAAVVDGAAANG